jgi:hypothetical protein
VRARAGLVVHGAASSSSSRRRCSAAVIGVLLGTMVVVDGAGCGQPPGRRRASLAVVTRSETRPQRRLGLKRLPSSGRSTRVFPEPSSDVGPTARTRRQVDGSGHGLGDDAAVTNLGGDHGRHFGDEGPHTGEPNDLAEWPPMVCSALGQRSQVGKPGVVHQVGASAPSSRPTNRIGC